MKFFFEKELPGTKQGYKFGIEIKRKVFSTKSKYQKVDIFDTDAFGRVLALDGIIQLSQKYEFIYHEMMTNLPLFCHSNPEKVLIVGGGDGGILREVLKHPVKEAYLVDIDEKVIEVSKKFLPFLKLKESLKDKRAKLIIADGSKFVKKFRDFFDVVIVDSTDPIGPSCILFSKKFYKSIFNALSKDGAMITQSGNWLDQIEEVKNVQKKLEAIFPFVRIHKAFVPDYQGSEFTFALASKKKLNYKKRLFKKPLRYYSPQIHLASGVLPKFLEDKLK